MSESPSGSFGQYQIIEKIAQGGMAEIFKGHALDAHGIGRPVVIKRILPHIAASPEFVQMLIDEAKIAVMLSHGNIAQIYDLGKVADDYFIVMEYVEGKTLSQIMKRLRTEGRHIPIAYAIAICAEVAKGLDYMHRKLDENGNPLHVVHRDISPQNVILSTAGTVKIIDFGIAKAKNKISTTDSGILKGKFAYMSPEHAEGEKLNHQSDIFSLGVILFELITDQRLFKGKNNMDTVRKVKRAKVPQPSGIRRGIPKDLDDIILRALQKDRKKRYASAENFSQDLTKLLVNHFSEFSPRDLVSFLKEIFPELSPIVVTSQPEETPTAPLVIKKGETRDPEEETAAADSALLKLKLRESEVFDVRPQTQGFPSQEESGLEREEETTILKPWRRLAKLSIFTLLGLALLMGVVYLYQHRVRGPTPVPLVEQHLPEQHIVQKEILEQVLKRQTTPKNQKITPIPAISGPIRSSSHGTLVITSEPPGAAIFIDDESINQKTPATLHQVSTNKVHKIGLSLDHYKFWEGTAQVEAEKTTTLSTPLEINFGDLEINSLPTGAEVFLNGQSTGRTPFEMSKLVPGTTYDVVLKQRGYEDISRSIKIFGGRKEVLNLSLKKAQ